MAKKRNLLLTTLLAVVCLTALLVASFVVGGENLPRKRKQERVMLNQKVLKYLLLMPR